MKFRPLFHLLLLISVFAWGFSSSFERLEKDYLASIFSHSRAEVASADRKLSDQVLFIDFAEKEKDEYTQWPPVPLDYLTVVKRLTASDPSMVVIPDTMKWENESKVEYLKDFKDSLIPFSRVLLGFSLDSNSDKVSEDGLIFSISDMPKVTGVFRNPESIPRAMQVGKVPSVEFRSILDLGFNEILSKPLDPWLAAKLPNNELVPSLLYQAVTLYRGVPHATQSITAGKNSTWNLDNRYLLPVSEDGRLALQNLVQVPRLNALDILTPDLGNLSSTEIQALLGKHKILVLGQSPANGTLGLAYQHAQWIASVLEIQPSHRLPSWSNFLIGAAGFILAIRQIWFRRLGALFYGGGILAVGLALAIMVYQTTQVWWSPLGGFIILASTLYCVFWGRQDSPKKDDTKKADPKKADPKKAEPKKEEPKKEDPKKDDTKKEEPKKEEPKKEEPKKEEPKKEEPKA